MSDTSADIVDKWASQVQMQSKLSRSISNHMYIVNCAQSEEMRRLGAAQQKCILYFNRYGVTLALARSRSVMAFWPLKTIRNYEFSEANNEFVLEAGRRAPMGEGLYLFFTTGEGKCQEMFQTIDGFIVGLLHKKAELTNDGNKPDENADEARAYLQLYESAIIGHPPPPPSQQQKPLPPPQQQKPALVQSYQAQRTPAYNAIFQQDDHGTGNSVSSSAIYGGGGVSEEIYGTGASNHSTYDRADHSANQTVS